MRKMLVGLLTTLAVCAVFSTPPPAYADVCLPHWRSIPLKMRTNANNGVIDSTFYYAGIGAGPNVDTTAAFPLLEVAFDTPVTAGAAGVDSLNVMTLHIVPRLAAGGGVAPSGDSMYVASQVSMDGRSWQTMTPTRIFDATKVVGGTTYTNGAIVLEGVTDLNTYSVAWRQAHSEVLGFYQSLEGTAASTIQWFGWRFVRWIIVSDAVGQYEVSLDYRSQRCGDVN